jgi:hypothetical protein
MKYIKLFEYITGNFVNYKVGDIVICDKTVGRGGKIELQENKKYKVLKIYKLPEDKFLKNPFMRVDVEDLETDIITKGWESTRFKAEMEFDADKYNM